MLVLIVLRQTIAVFARRTSQLAVGRHKLAIIVTKINRMTRQILATLPMVLALAAPAAAQPYSKSMAECAGLFAFGFDNVADERAARIYEHGRNKWIIAAVAQAEVEGVADPVATVDAHMAAKKAEWEAGGMFVVFSEEFGDWIDYCRSFAEAQGIDLNPA